MPPALPYLWSYVVSRGAKNNTCNHILKNIINGIITIVLYMANEILFPEKQYPLNFGLFSGQGASRKIKIYERRKLDQCFVPYGPIFLVEYVGSHFSIWLCQLTYYSQNTVTKGTKNDFPLFWIIRSY